MVPHVSCRMLYDIWNPRLDSNSGFSLWNPEVSQTRTKTDMKRDEVLINEDARPV